MSNPKFEEVESFAVMVEGTKEPTLATVRLRKQLDYKPSRCARGPYCLDLRVGSHCESRYGLDADLAQAEITQFLLAHSPLCAEAYRLGLIH